MSKQDKKVAIDRLVMKLRQVERSGDGNLLKEALAIAECLSEAA